jgi:hypothetical protein
MSLPQLPILRLSTGGAWGGHYCSCSSLMRYGICQGVVCVALSPSVMCASLSWMSHGRKTSVCLIALAHLQFINQRLQTWVGKP